MALTAGLIASMRAIAASIRSTGGISLVPMRRRSSTAESANISSLLVVTPCSLLSDRSRQRSHAAADRAPQTRHVMARRHLEEGRIGDLALGDRLDGAGMEPA